MNDSTNGLPNTGIPWVDIHKALIERRESCRDMSWDNLHNLKASYNAGDDVVDVAWNAFTLFKGDNLLYSNSLYPSLNTLADDVVNMALALLNASEDAGGTITTGGTESILLAVLSAYSEATQKRKFTGTPEIIAPLHAHAAFDKAAKLMGLNIVRVPLKEYRVDAELLAKSVTTNTFMIVGSAPAYPLGHVDPIAELSSIAEQYDLWLHVDACVGGLFLPFAVSLGYTVPNFDFSVPGVCSISVDLHKYGYTARGASLLLVQKKEMTQLHYFNFSEWPTGSFNTPTFIGSRPAGAIASAWAVMNYLGYEGYRDRVRKILEAKEQIIQSVSSIGGVQPCGNPEGGIVGFISPSNKLDMLAVRDGMTARNWQTAAVIDPPGFQILLNYRHGEVVEEFARDLEQIVELVRTGKLIANGDDVSYGG